MKELIKESEIVTNSNNKKDAAVYTLESLNYTYKEGYMAWKPPLADAPKFPRYVCNGKGD